ncbi:MAG: YARHG domain-containing protein [Roseburia sp.]|nr:YARHG domain-containing protein [Roseburia sp.]
MIAINNKTLCEYCFKEIDKEPCPHCGFSRGAYVRDPVVLAVGSVLENRYIVGGVIGKGGFGITYLAYDRKLERRVAIKEYYPYGLASRSPGNTYVATVGADSMEVFKEGADKFYDEARLVAKFNDNPNIVSVYDFFYENDTVYFTMGFLKGQTLKAYIRDHGVLTAGQTIQVAKDVTNALLAAHHLNVLHRDISPDNIMICSDGTIKLLDFGAARQVLTEGSQSLSVILKQGFAPLEQYQKKGKQGPWTDIYALGATLYYALTLDLLDDPMSRLEDDSAYSSNIHNIDAPLWEIIRKATMLRASERYRDMESFQGALAALDIRPERLTMSEDSVERIKFEPFAGVSVNLSAGKTGMAGTVAYMEAGGATVPASADAGVTQALREDADIGVTQALREDADIGVTQALREDADIGVTQALREDAGLGVTQALREDAPVGVAPAVKRPTVTPVVKAPAEPAREPDTVPPPKKKEKKEKKEKKKKLNLKVIVGIGVALILAAILFSPDDTEEDREAVIADMERKKSGAADTDTEETVVSGDTDTEEETADSGDTETVEETRDAPPGGPDGPGAGSEEPQEPAPEQEEAPRNDWRSEYILPDSDSRYLTYDDLRGMTAEECRLARNELFARHGRRFRDEQLQEYFNSKSWYHATVEPDEFDETVFNEYEFANRDLIIRYEKEMGYTK